MFMLAHHNAHQRFYRVENIGAFFSITHSALTAMAASVNSGLERVLFLAMDSSTWVAQMTGT
jgi:hypothetical protein